AAGLAEQMIDLEPEPRDILTLRSETAKPVLTGMLTDAGHRVRSVVAYRTVGVPVTERIANDVRSGR
ncbi:MAG TPA: uroporphyrinogen III synthase, partial [Microbacterium sp.]|nr:uroporphyrinogen III synthase [Microbacterium sp.]